MSLLSLPHPKTQEQTVCRPRIFIWAEQGWFIAYQNTDLTTAWAPKFTSNHIQNTRGFYNPGILCYRNSAILVFLHSPLFLNWLERYYRAHESCGSEGKCLICGLYELCIAYWGTDPDKAAGFGGSLMSVWTRLRETSWSYAEEKDQQDVREFMDRLLEELLNEIDEEG